MPRTVPIPPEWQGVAFRTSDPHGLSRGRLRGADVRAPHRGIRVVGPEPDSVVDRCRQVVPALPAGAVFCSVTAALLYRMPLPHNLDDDPRLHVTVAPGHQPPRARSIVGHRYTLRRDLWAAGGLPVADPVEAWLQLASVLSREDLVAVGDFLVSGRVIPGGREPPLATIADLRAAVEASPGIRGRRNLQWAASRVCTGVDSRPETHLRLLLIEHVLPNPVVNQTIYSASGSWLGTPDLAYPERMVLFEYEGDYHRTDARTFRRDIARRERFEEHGWRVVRVTGDDLSGSRRAFIARARRILGIRDSRAQ
ncbi:MAG: hypothetical protein ABWX65_08420 [Mycetocola sp.]